MGQLELTQQGGYDLTCLVGRSGKTIVNLYHRPVCPRIPSLQWIRRMTPVSQSLDVQDSWILCKPALDSVNLLWVNKGKKKKQQKDCLQPSGGGSFFIAPDASHIVPAGFHRASQSFNGVWWSIDKTLFWCPRMSEAAKRGEVNGGSVSEILMRNMRHKNRVVLHS